MLIFRLAWVVAFNDLGQHEVQSKEGAKNDQEDEKYCDEERLIRVRVVIEHEDPALEWDGHEDAAHGGGEIVEVDNVEHDELVPVS